MKWRISLDFAIDLLVIFLDYCHYISLDGRDLANEGFSLHFIGLSISFLIKFKGV